MNTLTRILRTLAKSLKFAAEEVEKAEKALEKIKANVAKEQKKKKRAAKTKSTKRVTSKRPARRTSTDIVMTIIERNKKGVNTATIEKRTGFSKTKIQGIIYNLKKQGKITNVKRGIYVKA